MRKKHNLVYTETMLYSPKTYDKNTFMSKLPGLLKLKKPQHLPDVDIDYKAPLSDKCLFLIPLNEKDM